MPFLYDDQNVFAKILRGEIPATPILDTAHTLAFRDLRPQAPDHVLVIPKGAYVTYDHFAAEASEAEILDFTRAIARLSAELGASIAGGGEGFRLISNAGPHSGQEVPHMHVHLLAGRPLGPLLAG